MRLQCLQVRTCPLYITRNATGDSPPFSPWFEDTMECGGFGGGGSSHTVRLWQFECLPGCVQNRVVRFRVSCQIWKSRRGYPHLAPRLARLLFLTQFKILTLNTKSKILHQDPCHVQLLLLHVLLRERSKCTF